ncbi:MAG: DegV family protein [Solirubrobacteraceae bacterium]|jgi:DegV family protein with EDD domain|nr:DegV family protein [Solirubrobacteraceae bacterium]
MPVAVVTDSTHYLPRAVAQEAGLHQVSLYSNDGGTLVRETDLPDFDEFYRRLTTQSDLPTTSQPSIGDFLEVYEPLLEAGLDIVSVHLGAGISGTCEAAGQAAAELTGRGGQRRIEVVNSRSACGGLGLIVLATAAAARAGHDVEQVAARAHAAADDVRIWFAVDTLEYLRRGGRIGGAQAWVGGALKIKPILTFDDAITPVERVRTEKRAFERMVEFLRDLKADGREAWVVQHIQAPAQAERLREAGLEIFGTEPVFLSEIGPVIGTHAGPGLIGVGGLSPALLA